MRRLLSNLRLFTASTVVAVIATVLSIAPPAQATFSGDNGLIAFVGGDPAAPPGVRPANAWPPPHRRLSRPRP